ncbi:TIGR04222 domain-containing membrane protein [Amycolatopsis sp. FU40]|uniref:TIGR04222 domain-containing membrane protein n=1 Tax=Amycolatopsis sp. FU40 TaxID=2914159 RepID=UPI001F477AA1|nr:TIGR04222 domain-containing membrane protein [Amycolatopsis sp. FU40]UKD55783.1 TIGR04222 domain-containing membrane protein [Amycolatopsis sp. FU40]
MDWTIERAMPAALILVLALACWWLGRRTAARLNRGRHPETRLTSAAQVALLTNGPIRVAETTVASMLEREQLRADSVGRLYRTPTAPSDALSREAAELTGTGVGVATVLRGLVEGDTVRELIDDLTKRGLLVDGQALRRAWKWTAIEEAVLAAAGVAAFVGGLNGYVLISVLLPAWFAFAALSRRRAARRIRPTDAGRTAAEAAWPDRSLISGLTGSVAVGGLSNHPDRELRIALLRGLPATRRTGVAIAGAAGGFAGPAGYWAAGSGCASGCGGGAGCGSGCGGSGCGGGCGGGGCGGGNS